MIRNGALRKKILLGFLLAVPVLYFFTVVILYSVNLPYRDDYATILLFLNRWSDSATALQKFNLVVQPMFDHRVVLVRLISAFLYRVFGFVDFQVLIVTGAAGLLVGCYALYTVFRRGEAFSAKALSFFPVVILFFTFLTSENLFQGMASVSLFYPITLGLASLALLDNKRDCSPVYAVAAAVLAVMAYFAHREGLVFLLTGFLLLLYRKKWALASVWAVFSAGAFVFFVSYRPAPSSGLYLAVDPGQIGSMLSYFFSFIGNVFGFNPESEYFLRGGPAVRFLSSAVPVIAGVAVCVAFGVITVLRYDRRNPAVYAMLLSLFIIAAGAALQRSNVSPLVSRYRIVTILFYICLYVAFLEIILPRTWSRHLVAAVVGVCILYSAAVSVLKFKPIIRHRDELVSTFSQWRRTGDGLISIAWDPPDPRPILDESLRKKIYRLPKFIEEIRPEKRAARPPQPK